MPLSASTMCAAIALVWLTGCGSSGSSSSPASALPVEADEPLSAAAQLGEKIFSDTSLSVSGKQACASCHDPKNAYAQANDLPVQPGGPNGDVAGFRAAPSLRYLERKPAFFFSKDGTPTGGFTWDGRAPSLMVQAERPFLAPHEMANASKAEVVGLLAKAQYAGQFKHVFGESIFNDAEQAFARMTYALQQYQLEDPDFHPYDSKYDRFLAGKVKLEAAELRGLALFNDKAKGNCAACHPSTRGTDGSAPLFTDFTYDNLGVPRNMHIAATQDAKYFDLGLCGPDRLDLADRTDLCGKFKVPTLRNVATRRAFFHNGAFGKLSDVLHFYVQRDTSPELWYPRAADGSVQKFNDIPLAWRANVNTTEAPYNRQPGMAPALSEREIDDVLAFLATLNDNDLIQSSK
jgi:cytochrome c peroxidase